MRDDLESFVNQGLEEGWNGWPLKSWSFDAGKEWLEVENRGAEFLGFTPEESFRASRRFRRLFQACLQDMDGLS